MARSRLVSTLAGVGALVLAGCGGGAEVAVEEPRAPTPAASAEPSAPSGTGPGDERRTVEEVDATEPEREQERDQEQEPKAASPAAPAGDGPAEPGEPAAATDDGRPRDAADAPTAQAGRGNSAEAGAAVEQKGDPGTSAEESSQTGGAPAISIERPAAGSQHGGGPVTAEGEATVYEGTVLLTLVGPDGSVVEEGFATATFGAPERGRWSHTFDTAAEAPGRWRVVAAASDPSDGEGRPPARTVAEFHVVGSG